MYIFFQIQHTKYILYTLNLTEVLHLSYKQNPVSVTLGHLNLGVGGVRPGTSLMHEGGSVHMCVEKRGGFGSVYVSRRGEGVGVCMCLEDGSVYVFRRGECVCV